VIPTSDTSVTKFRENLLNISDVLNGGTDRQTDRRTDIQHGDPVDIFPSLQPKTVDSIQLLAQFSYIRGARCFFEKLIVAQPINTFSHRLQ
jgi:hypothetical protein